ncbi:hypothetical protein HYU10_00965 [Candidatus Woesearchaeota archaeon]|nr:hypothetical protein [Candidatus Woesearchaeota archaeon]MBI2661773.1 hypothetical protein [Candidatus Woesearchaeota archaeon]
MRKKRAQSAVEMMIILAVGLAILIGILNIFFKANDSFSGQLESKKARAAVDAVADAAGMVYQQGVGSKTRVYVTLPENVNHINLTQRLVLINFNSGGNPRDVYRSLDFNISGSLPADEGSLWVYLESREGYVQVSSNSTG